MKKKRLLIIDDRLDYRKEIYTKVLADDFSITFVEKGSQLFDSINKTDVDAYIIDIVLSKWLDTNNKPLQVITVLEKIKNNKPIILVSNEYENLVKGKELTPLINSIIDKGFNVNSFLIWSEFLKAANKQDDNYTQTIQNIISLDIIRHMKFEKIRNEDKFDFAIICALGEELKPFMDNFPTSTISTIENIHVNKGKLNTKQGKTLRFIAVQQEEMGTVDSAIITSRIISKYNVKHVFMIGVCGGRDGKVKIGDLIIPHEIIAYQKGKITSKGLEINVGYAKSKGNIKAAIQNKCDSQIQSLYERYISKSAKAGFSLDVKTPSLIFNEMACGESVINRVGELDKIAKATKKPKLCAVDMESFSIFRIGEILNIKTSVIKSVMDLSSNKSDKYKDYAAYISANFLYSIIYEELITFID